MAYNVPNCVANLRNTGLSNCLDELGVTLFPIWTSDTYEIDTEANALLEATWVDNIDANNLYPFPLAEEGEDSSEDDTYQETSRRNRIFIAEGKYGETLKMRVALCDLPKLRSFNNVAGRVFLVMESTGGNKIFGTTPDGVKFKGFKLSEFNVSKLKGTDGSNARMVDIYFQLALPSEMADHPAVPLLTWDPAELTGLVDVEVEVVGTAVEGSAVLSVTRGCDGETVDGLVEADFTILASDGTTSMSADTFTDNGDGTYTFAFTTPVLPADTYTANLKAASAQTTGGYAPGTADSFTIS